MSIGTILAIVLVLVLLGVFRPGVTAATGVMDRAALSDCCC
jgi:hypothetical protein